MLMAQPTRVAYVVKRYPRFSETFIVNEILAHEAAGLEVEIFSLRPPVDTHFQDRISRIRAPVTYIPSQSLKGGTFWEALQKAADIIPSLWETMDLARGEDAHDVYQALVLAREVHLRGIDHVHAHFASAAATIARLAAGFAKQSFTITAHAKDIFHEQIDPDDLRRKVSDAATVITVSDFNVAYLREKFGEMTSHVERVYNGMDVNEFPYLSPADREPRIVAVGRLIEKKGFADLIDACARMDAQGRTFSCKIVGTGELEDELRSQIDSLELAHCVELTGPRPQAEVVRLVHESAVLAAPCVIGEDGNRDGLPTVLLEAMALGTPCVSTDVTGIPEAIRHNETGLSVPQHDPESLAAAIGRLFDEPALRTRLAEAARTLIEDEFDIHRNTQRLRNIFVNCSRGNGTANSTDAQGVKG